MHALLFLSALSLVAADATKPEPSAAEKRLDALGELKDDLGFWIGMNALEHGGIEWARFEFQLKVNDNFSLRVNREINS